MDALRIDIEYEKGKSTYIAKEVDKKAKQSAKQVVKIADQGFREGKLYRSVLPGETAQLFAAQGQKEVVRIYRKDSIYRNKRIEWKIYFEVFSEMENRYVSKNFAYTSPKNEGNLHRSHSYRVQFNDNPKYPIIEGVVEEVELKG